LAVGAGPQRWNRKGAAAARFQYPAHKWYSIRGPVLKVKFYSGFLVIKLKVKEKMFKRLRPVSAFTFKYFS